MGLRDRARVQGDYAFTMFVVEGTLSFPKP